MVSRTSLLLLSCCVLSGCYSYRALAPRSAQPATYLAVTLTDDGSEELTRYLGPDVAIVRGRFRGASAQGLALSVAQVELHRGGVLSWRGETVVVPRVFVASVEERRVSGGRTVLLAGASIIALIATYQALGSSGGGPGGTSGTPTPR